MARQYRQRTIRTGADEIAQWDDMVAPFVGTQNNPRKKKVPAHMKQSRRGPPYVYPKTKSYPINDLFHARLALIYIMSPTNAPKRKRVIEAVAKRFPEYNWATWWNKEIKKPKKDSSLKTWSYYLKGKVSRSRRGGWEQWDTATKHRNPGICPRSKTAAKSVAQMARRKKTSAFAKAGAILKEMSPRTKLSNYPTLQSRKKRIAQLRKQGRSAKAFEGVRRNTRKKNPIKRKNSRRSDASKAMRMAHREGISLKAAWRKVKRGR